MALENHAQINGIDVNRILQQDAQRYKEMTTTRMDIEKAPVLGLLTQTVLRSPLVHWILPARLRNNWTDDVALIGDDFIQIQELRADGKLWDIVRKENFGARIRNARVVGSIDASIITIRSRSKRSGVSNSSEESDSSTVESMPPQVILLQLDTGDSVFLMLRKRDDGKIDFTSSRYRVSKPMLKLQPGMHLTVDPSSRYVAIGCSEGIFAIYSLTARDELREKYFAESQPRYVDSATHIYVPGIIHKMEFLHPSPGDDAHIILLVLVISRGRTRMVLYDWSAGEDLKQIRSRTNRGYTLEKSRRMPNLLIPLKLKSSFILVCEEGMSVCEGILSSSPYFIEFNGKNDPPTKSFHGTGIPLWTSWTRPVRTQQRAMSKDDIYIAREDGLIKYLEIDGRVDEFVSTDNNIGQFGASCGRALASLDFEHISLQPRSGDLLITGGDSCSGGTYLIEARAVPVFTEPVQNWSPATDLATTYVASTTGIPEGRFRPQYVGTKVPKPDRVFACMGKGINGAVTEFRYGLEASIQLMMDFPDPILGVWSLSPQYQDDPDAYIFVLSMIDRTAVLRLSSDLANIEEQDEMTTKLDLQHRTLATAVQGCYTMQVTERSIVLLESGGQSHRYSVTELLHINESDLNSKHDHTIQNAAIVDTAVLFTAETKDCTILQIFQPEDPAEQMELDNVDFPLIFASFRTLCVLPTHATALTIGRFGNDRYAIAAGWIENSIVLTFQCIDSSANHSLHVLPTSGDDELGLGAIVSILVIPSQDSNPLLVCGTRNGNVMALEINRKDFTVVGRRCDRIGATSALLVQDEFSSSGDLVFVSCDSRVYSLQPKSRGETAGLSKSWLRGLSINRVWLTDAARPGLQQPIINAMSRLRPNPSSATEGGLLFATDSELLITGLTLQPKAVPRHINIGGTPTRLIYSQTLDVLIVAASVGGYSTILHIDPDTGANLSQPVCLKTGEAVEYAGGLGQRKERIYRLFEWVYTKDTNSWNFLIVTTSAGRLLIINQNTDREGRFSASNDRNGTLAARPKIIFSTRTKFKAPEPVYSAAGFGDGIIWCSGLKLYCETLDLAQKEFVRKAEYDLPSPATKLDYDGNTIYVLTYSHSLEILKLVEESRGKYKILRTHGDQLARQTLHHTVTDQPADRPMHLVSDKAASIVGLWPSHNTKADTLETVLEAELSNSVLRFRHARCRPVWDPVWRRDHKESECSTNSVTTPGSLTSLETLGLSITGSLSHYTILDTTSWKFLRFIINLAICSPRVCEFTHDNREQLPLEPFSEPKIMMHINGDILKRCLEDGTLEELLKLGEHTPAAGKIWDKFSELLRELHGGTLEVNAEKTTLVSQAYTDLRFYLRPVL